MTDNPTIPDRPLPGPTPIQPPAPTIPQRPLAPTLPQAPAEPAPPQTRLAPTLPQVPSAPSGQQVDEWLDLSNRTHDPNTALDYAQRAVDAQPDDPRVHASVQRGVLGRLGQDAFVAYMAETDATYVVTFRNSRPVLVPKARALPEAYPPEHPTPTQRVWTLVALMVLGLIPAGLGALALSPVAVPRAAAIATDPHTDPRERRSAWLALVLGAVLGLLGAALAFILLLHIIG